jgi:NAD(P)-dependent dehydrogenase (short-subunit alcohol dehydrogenase family)
VALGRPGTPEDIAKGALYLASDDASYVTATVLVIDGGWTAGFARDW